MDPVWWLAIGLVVASGLLGAGYFVGRATLTDDLRRAANDKDILLRQLSAALTQGESGAEAARIVVDSAIRVAAAGRASDPRERHRLLLGGVADDASSPSPPGGEA